MSRPRSPNTLDPLSAALGRRLKELRGLRSWSLDKMARASGVSRSMLSQIERGRANPTVVVSFRIARALGVSISELLEGPETTSFSVIRGDDLAYLFRADPQRTIRTLSPLSLEKDVEFYQLRLAPGGELRSAPHFRGTRELLTVQKGRVRLEAGTQAEDLGPGDSAAYRGDLPHAIVNLGRTPAIIFLVDIYPSTT
jgi:transcriptional regulator with XRE-family HTH domain